MNAHHLPYEIKQGDCLDVLKKMPDQSVNCCVTSPPYFGLRDYGHEGQVGLEETPDAFVQKMVEVFREVRRVLADDGTCWVNLGDSYASNGIKTGKINNQSSNLQGGKSTQANAASVKGKFIYDTKPKNLMGIPWRVAFALQADGWYLRQDIIWCLSGGTYIYAKTQKGEMPTAIKDIARLNPETVQLWNGEKWTQLLGVSKSARIGNEIEIVLRSGERISCTPTHKFPTERGLLEAKDIVVGDTLESCRLPEPDKVKDCAIDEDAAWLAGLYIAEGSRSEDTIQIAGHAKETERYGRLQSIAVKYGGSITRTIDGNKMNIRIYGKVLNAIVRELVSGKIAKDKCFSPVVWKYSNSFIASMIDGYLSGDGHKDGDRWRLGFCRNYNLERDLRTACARLGYSLTLNMASTEYNGRRNPTFRGELRKAVSNHWNNKNRNEVVEIRKARARQFYDIGVADDPHLFALASGVLTHNSKPNPMPESVTDRCTKAHEYIFLLTKSAKYFYDAEAVKEAAETCGERKATRTPSGNMDTRGVTRTSCAQKMGGSPNGTRNRRSVWTVTTKPYKEAHFATYPPDLIRPCILAGCPKGGTVLDPFNGAATTGVVATAEGRKYIGIELNPKYVEMSLKRLKQSNMQLNLFQ